MRRLLVLCVCVGTSALGNAAPPEETALPTDFEFVRREKCDVDEVADGDKINIKRERDLVTARIALLVNCAIHSEKPKVQYLNDRVELSVELVGMKNSDGSDVVYSCMCSEVLMFKLLRPVPKGTLIAFVADGEQHLKGIAP